MIPNTGLVFCLQSVTFNISISCEWILFVNDIVIDDATVLGDLVEADWDGYIRVPNSSNTAPIVTAMVAENQPVTNPQFANDSAETVQFFGWALVTAVDGTLVGAANVGSSNLAPGQSVVVLANFSLQEVL